MANANIGKTKRSTDELIDNAVNRQQSWLERRREFTRAFLKRFNVFSSHEEKVVKKSNNKKTVNKNKTLLKA